MANADWATERPQGRPAARRAKALAEPPHDGNLDALALLLAEPLRGQARRLARNGDVQAAWAAWLEMRRAKRHPMTERALKAALKVLSAMHPNPDAAYNCLDHSTDGGWQGLFPRSKPLWIPLPAHQARLAAAGIRPAEAGAPTEADLSALEDYKRQAVDMSPPERAGLLKKCSDTLPLLAGSLAAHIWRLNNGVTKEKADALMDLSRSMAGTMRAERAETSPRVWHNRMNEVEQKEAKGGGS